MNERYTEADRVSGGIQDGALAGAGSRVDHLHFDRQARVWRTHAELARRGTAEALRRAALPVGGGAEAA